jgi:hypothetical protein
MVAEDGDLSNALNYILANLRDHPRQQDRSVVIMSVGTGSGETYENSQRDPIIQEWYKEPIRKLFEMGVPVVCAAGNNDDNTMPRPVIDSLPMVLADADFPIINVGAADYEGKREAHSKLGKVTLYAPGLNVEAQTKVDSGERKESGTSVGESS